MMAVPISTKSAGKYHQSRKIRTSRRHNTWGLFLGAALLALFAAGFITQNTLAPQAKPNEGYTSAESNLSGEPKKSDDKIILPLSTPMKVATQVPAETQPVPTEAPTSSVPTEAQTIQYQSDAPILYYAQSGDSIGVLAVRFGVEVSDITSTAPLPQEGFLPEGQLLLIPARLGETSLGQKLFPDSEVVNSPSSIDFDVDGFIQSAGGYLSTYHESVNSAGFISGAQIIEKVATEFSIHPRLLLSLLEYKSGWVDGTPATANALHYPLGLVDDGKMGLFKQLEWAAGEIETGYYGWREGTTVVLSFPDNSQLRLAAELNCGSVGMMYFFSQFLNPQDWFLALYGDQSFFSVYAGMFGDPWATAQNYEPLFTPDLLQPNFILPFEVGVIWSMTYGPHAAWGAADVRAALDFAPPGSAPGCVRSNRWVVAAAPGIVVRSEYGAVVVDLDGDGYEQTGWNVIYMHIATENRVPVGTWLETGQNIGHPSCEGGIATGTHTHLVRKYNGEWVPADGPLPFNLGGWKAKAGPGKPSGWLIKGDQIVRASLVGGAESQVTRWE